MDLDRPSFDTDSLDQLAAFTGLGWTTSLCGFLVVGLGYGPGLLQRVFVDTAVLLYVSLGFLLATLALDRLARTLSDDGTDQPDEHPESGARPAD